MRSKRNQQGIDDMVSLYVVALMQDKPDQSVSACLGRGF